jgi:Na+-transporting NADH:ubiquinone oxidoreductase subunit C
MSDLSKIYDKFKVILFALVVSVVCSFLITAAAIGLKDRQRANMALDKRINLLKAANLIPEKKPGREQINALYDRHIQDVWVDAQGRQIETPQSEALQLFLIKNQDDISGYILPISTRGLWGKIHGYLAFENDGQTVAGFSVYSHSETPGLGGEIESAWFQKNFKGKKIINSQNQFVSVGIAKGKVENLPEEKRPYYVDGISGATLTGKYLSEGIKETLEQTSPVTIKFIQRQLKSGQTLPRPENSAPISQDLTPNQGE